jgi:hypothetical protein
MGFFKWLVRGVSVTTDKPVTIPALTATALTAGAITSSGLIGSSVGSSAASTTALVVGTGTNAAPVATATAAKNAYDVRLKTTATSGENRNVYARTEFAGAGSSGEAVRGNTVLTAAAANVHGVHGSVDAQASGSVTGLAAGVRGGILARDSAMAANGTYAAIHADMYANGASTNVAPVTELSFFRCNLDGNATGIANIEDKAYFLTFNGGTNASGNVASDAGNEPSWTGKVIKLRAKVNGVAGSILFVAD